ncbi:7285_t:CDS:1, partial [Scutellospora calospora]
LINNSKLFDNNNGNKNSLTLKSNSQREFDYSTTSLFSIIYTLQCWWSSQFIKQQLRLRERLKKSKVFQNILYNQDELERVLDDLQKNPVIRNDRIIDAKDDKDSSFIMRKRFCRRQKMLQLQPSVPTIFEEDESEMRFEYESHEIMNSEYGYLTTIIEEEDDDDSGDSGYNSSNERTSDPYEKQFFNISGLDYSSIHQSSQFFTTL